MNLKNTIAVITARGGSKRIPKKNIREFFGKPMLHYAIGACKDAGIFSEIMVSTDSAEIAEIAETAGARVPFTRSEKTSDDFASTFDVLEEVIADYRNNGREFDTVCCVYPCVPFLSGQTLRNAYDRVSVSDYDALLPVCRFPAPIERALRIEDGRLIPDDTKAQSLRSQDLEQKYFDVGMFYIIKTSVLLSEKTLVPAKTMAYIMDESYVQDINTEDDWKTAELKYKLIIGRENG